MPALRIAAGHTVPGATAWYAYQGSRPGVVVDVDTSASRFQSTPIYVTSLGGESHWRTTGGDCVYYPTPSGFRLYVRFSDDGPITPQQANLNKWHVNWIGIEGG
jgi:hypothetical protein